jgi:predicted nuclease of predicted toxin-antitoxin system
MVKLLVDQNLSRGLIGGLQQAFPGSRHVTDLGLDTASDMEIWEFARDNGFAILSKDADFHHLSFRFGAPPKTVWIKLGNSSTREIGLCLNQRMRALQAFLGDPDSALMIINADAVESR